MELTWEETKIIKKGIAAIAATLDDDETDVAATLMLRINLIEQIAKAAQKRLQNEPKSN